MTKRRFPERGGRGRQGRRDRDQKPETQDFWSRLLVKGPENEFLEKTACPACGEMAGKLAARVGPTWLRRCRACSVTYVSPRLTETVRHQIATRGGSLDSPTNLMLRHHMAEQLQNMHREMFPLDGVARNAATLLELGSGWGHFLQLCRPHYREVEGVEISRDQAAHARERFDLEVSTVDVLRQPWNRSYHIIAAWDVLGQAAYPSLLAKWAFDHLLPGGQLVLSTPNYDSLWRRLLGPRWFYLDPARQLCYFTPATAKALLLKAGFSEVSIHTSGRSLFRERMNGHNKVDRRAEPRDKWLATLRTRERIVRERTEVTLDKSSFLKRAWHSALWRSINALAERGLGDQLRIYARKG